SEGPGVTARAGCNVPANVYADVAGADGVANTADDDFTPATGSSLLDAGLDPRTLGLDPVFNPLLEADSLKPAARPPPGSPGSAPRVLIVDNTPPDTEVITGAAGTTSATSATFTFRGADNLTPAMSLLFAWRLDSGAFTPFTAASSATLSNLAPGAHLFEVKAKDLAGNEDPSPAQRSFTVGSAIVLTVSNPIQGSLVPEGVLLVTG